MKVAKYIFAAILFLVAFWATGERFVYHIAYFEQTFYGITFEYALYGMQGTNQLAKEKLISDLAEHKFDIFYVSREPLSELEERITVYGTRGALDELSERGIKPMTYKSMFIGKIELIFKDIEDLENIYETDIFYYIGTFQNALEFKRISTDTSNRYYGVDELMSESGSEEGLHSTLALVWGISFSLVLLLTLFCVVIQKKEVAVRLALGKNPYHIFILDALADIIVFSLEFFLLEFFVCDVICVGHRFESIRMGFLVVILLNTLINSYIARISWRKDISMASGNKFILSVSYIVKCISVCLSCVVLSSNLIIMKEAIEYFGQSKYFEVLDDYCYYKITVTEKTRQNLSENRVEEKIWYEFDNMFGMNSVCMVSQNETFEKNSILLNKNAVNLLKPHMPDELKKKFDKSTEDKLYIFFPAEYSSDNIPETVQMAVAMYLSNEDDPYKYVIVEKYKDTANILSISSHINLNRSDFLRNPIIFFDNTTHSGNDYYLNPLYTSADIMYNVKPVELKEFLQATDMENEIIKVTNVQEVYQHNCKNMMRSIVLLSAVSLFMIGLEGAMTVFLARLEFSINGIELAIKKILGYGYFARGKKIIILPSLMILFCTFLSVLIEIQINFGSPVYTFVIGFFIGASEFFFAIIQIARIDRIRIHAILKGGKQ